MTQDVTAGGRRNGDRMSGTEGRRERNKRLKLENITNAAREVFSRRGFEEATLREIAAEAGIGYGTLFLYAENKEALLVLVFRSELGRVVDDSFANLPEADVRTQLRHMFAVVIRHHEENPVLFQPFLRQGMALGEAETAELRTFTENWRERLAALLRVAAARGDMALDHDVLIVADLLLDVLAAALRKWITEGISRDELEQRLDAAVALLCPSP